MQTTVKFYFTNLKLREKHFSNFKIQGVQAPMHPLSDDHANEGIMYIYGKPRSSRSKLTCLSHTLGVCNQNPNFRLRLRLNLVKVLASAPSAFAQSWLGSGTDSTAHLFHSVKRYHARLHCSFCVTSCQARNQLGIPGGKQRVFWKRLKYFELCPTHFSRGQTFF